MKDGEMMAWLKRLNEIREIKSRDMRSKRLKNLWNDLQQAYEYKKVIRSNNRFLIMFYHAVKRELSTIN